MIRSLSRRQSSMKKPSLESLEEVALDDTSLPLNGSPVADGATTTTKEKKRLGKRLSRKIRKSLGLKKKKKNIQNQTEVPPASTKTGGRIWLRRTPSAVSASSTTEDVESLLNSFDDEDESQFEQEVEEEERLPQTFFGKHVIAMAERGSQDENGRSLYFFTSQDKEDLQNALQRDFSEALVELVEQQHEQQSSSTVVDAHLHAASYLLEDFFLLDEGFLQNQMALPGTAQDLLFHELESFLYPRLSLLYLDNVGSDHQLTPGEAAKVVAWVEHEWIAAIQTKAPLLQVRDTWRLDCQHLTLHYLERAVRQEMKNHLARALDLMHTDEDVRQDGSGALVTGLAAQVSFLYQQQLNAAKQQQLDQSFTSSAVQPKQIVSVCHQELALVACDVQEKLNAEWEDVSPELLCAMINDTSALAEHCEAINDEYDVGDTEGGDVVRELAQVSMLATKYLCFHILQDLCKAADEDGDGILTSVGSEAWEMDECAVAMERTTATYQDFFGDLQVWLSGDYFLRKVLQKCFDLTLQTYLESFFRNTMSRGVVSVERTAAQLQQDYRSLVCFFSGSDYEGEGDGLGEFYSQQSINGELLIMQHMANLVSPAYDPEDVHRDILEVLQRFPGKQDGYGTEAVLHLVGMRKRHSQEESMRWINEIASAKTELDAAVESGAPSRKLSVDLDSLANSRFLQNVRPSRRTLRRANSDGILAPEDAAKLLRGQHRRVSRMVHSAKSKLISATLGTEGAEQ